MALGILLDDISNVIGFSCLLKLAPCYKIFYFSDGPDSIFVRFSQAKKCEGKPFYQEFAKRSSHTSQYGIFTFLKANLAKDSKWIEFLI